MNERLEGRDMRVKLAIMTGWIIRTALCFALLLSAAALVRADDATKDAPPPATEATYDETQPGADDPRVREGFEAYKAGDFKKAYDIWLPLADAGNAEAQYRMAALYSRGEGVSTDGKSAIYWLEHAAQQGHVIAAYNAGLYYNEGELNLPLSAAKAIKYYSLAANAGHAASAYNLGLIYDGGMEGIPRNNKLAMKHYKTAAAQCNVNALNNLGALFINIEPPARDYSEAYKWFLLAAKKGDPGAIRNRNVLLQYSSSAELKEGKRRMQAWIDDHACMQ